MGLQTVPGYISLAGYNHPAELLRNFNAAMAGRKTGALRYNDFVLTPSGSIMSLAIGAGDAVIMGTSATTQGGYYVWSNASENVAFPAAAGSPRIDSLILRVIDTQYGSDPSSPQALWEVVSGTPSGSPVAVLDSDLNVGGSLYRPGAWWRVADFTVPAGATNLAAATISHKRQYARIGRHSMGIGSVPADSQIGDEFTFLDGANVGKTFRYNGTIWVPNSVEMWTTYTPTLRNNAVSGTPAVISSTTVHAQYKIVGDMCFYECDVLANAAVSNGASVSLPVNAIQRWQNCGTAAIIGAGVTTPQSGLAYMSPSVAPFDRIVCTSYGAGYLDMPSGTWFRAQGFYKITPTP